MFEPFAAVRVKRMFGGAGVYAEGLCFAILAGGEAYLKVDGANEVKFRAAGSSPFVSTMRSKPTTMGYWRLPAEAYHDPDALKRWAALGIAAALPTEITPSSRTNDGGRSRTQTVRAVPALRPRQSVREPN